MDSGHSFSKSDLSVLWNRKSKRYTIKSFTENGHWITHLVLEDRCAGGTVIGKLVKRSSEEFRQRPWLHHRNLASLIDVVTIHDEFAVFISVYLQKSLREIVHDQQFVQSPNCFVLKKIYIEDVLWGLDYLHRNDLCLMNLTDANVFICEQPNKAVITDFECLAPVNAEGERKFAVPFIHQPPEIRTDGEQFDVKAAEIWVAGMMVMEIFTQHKLPWALVDYDPDRVQEMIDKVDYVLLKIANTGSTLSIPDLCEFKSFVDLFINNNPQRRCSPRDAALATFLQGPKDGLSLQKLAIRSNTGSGNNKSESFPSIHLLSIPYTNDIHTLKAIKNQVDEIETKKSKSNLSFKKCASYAKEINSYLQSHNIPQQNYVDFDNDVSSDTPNQAGKADSESNHTLNIDSVPKKNSFNDIRPLSKMKSKTSLSSQVECISCTSDKSVNESELNSNLPTSGYSDKIRNEGIDFIPVNRPYVTYKYSPTIKREMPDSTKILSPATKTLRKNILESCRKLSKELKNNDSPAKSAYQENSINKVTKKTPCTIDGCASSKNNYEDRHRQTTYGQFYGVLPTDSTRNIIEDYNRKGKSIDGVNDSFQKPSILVSKTCPEPKLETKITSKSPYTLSENHFSSHQSSTANSVSDLMAKTTHLINELQKDIDHDMFRQPEQIRQKSPVVNNIKTQSMFISDIKRSNQPSDGPAKFSLKKIPVPTHQKNVTHCQFQHGYRCPRHQKAELLDKSINQEADVSPNNKEYTSNNKCKNINEEPKVSDNNNSTWPLQFYPNYREEYYFPARTLYDLNNPSMFTNIQIPNGNDAPKNDEKKAAYGTHQLSSTQATRPNDAKKAAYGSHQLSPATRELADFFKNNMMLDETKDAQEAAEKEDQLQKVVLLRGPREQGKPLFRVEQAQRKSAKCTKKNAKKDASKKCKKSRKNASLECIIVSEDSGDEKKKSKKKSMKKCFCIGK